MGFTELQASLNTLYKNFSLGNENQIEDSVLGVRIIKNKFTSTPVEIDLPEYGGVKGLDTFIGYNSLAYRNNHFEYLIVEATKATKANGAIFLVHGLNERSWNKYLAWAYQLAYKTGKSVILFPIAFHMNRSPEAWHDSRQMSSFVETRKKYSEGNKNLSFANIAISERLTYAPDTFFLSGYQSAKDIYLLSRAIKEGKHPLFDKDATIDFFGYSFGAFLEEILLIANPDGIFNNSKFFFFCGGCVFSEFNGSSKFILSKSAFERIRQFYVDELPIELRRSSLLSQLLNNTMFGNAFRQLCTLDEFNKQSDDVKTRFKNNVTVVALEKDEIVSRKALEKTLNKKNLNFIDFDYPYSHENPFPETENDTSKHVDNAFSSFITKAVSVLQ